MRRVCGYRAQPPAFTAAEKTAIMNFVANGGGLMMIADHTAATTGGTDSNGYNPSDRDGDGYDSPRVWNDLMTNNGINNNNPFGFNIDYVDINEQPSIQCIHRLPMPMLQKY